MRNKLGIGNSININGVTFLIKDIVGEGASSVVYLTENKQDGTVHLLKEFCPAQINIRRDKTGAFILPGGKNEEHFLKLRERFRTAADVQIRLRKEYDELTNVTTNVNGIYFANNTCYIDMPAFFGKVYDIIEEESLYNLLSRIRSLCKIIASYHKIGYLHLDIKPANIFAIPESCDLLMLFDFDSVIKKSDIHAGKMISYSEKWAAPELFKIYEHKNICETADLYSIGEIIFYKLFNRHSDILDHKRSAVFDYSEARLCADINPVALPKLTQLLRHMLCVFPKERYQTADDVIIDLEELIELVRPQAQYLISDQIHKKFFVGREQELTWVHDALQENRIISLCGLGGVGKTELAKRYACVYGDEYDSVIFLSMQNGWISAVNSIAVKIVNFPMPKEEDRDLIFKSVIHKLKGIVSEKTLFILDNVCLKHFSENEADSRKEFLELNAKFILTTRETLENFHCLNVNKLGRKEAYHLFRNWYKKNTISIDDESAIYKIIDFVDSHTLTVELIAKQLNKERIFSPVQKLAQLKDIGLSTGSTSVLSDKDGILSKKTPFDHICDLFNIAGLNKHDQYILSNMAVMPIEGIACEEFLIYIGENDAGAIMDMVDLGWMKIDDNNIVSMHPVISEVVLNVLKGKTSFDSLLKSVKSLIEHKLASMPYLERQSVCELYLTIGNRLIRNNYGGDLFAEFLSLPSDIFAVGSIEERTRFNEYALSLLKTCEDNTSRICRAYFNLIDIELFEKNNIEQAELYLGCVEEQISCGNKQDLERTVGLYYTWKGSVCYLQANSIESARFFEKAIHQFELAYNASGSIDLLQEIADCQNNLGVINSHIGHLSEAEDLLKKSLEYCKNRYGSNDGNTLERINNLAYVFLKKKKLQIALEYSEMAKAIAETLYGDKSIKCTPEYMQLAKCYAGNAEYVEAERLLKKAKQIICDVYPESHSSRGDIYSHLADLYGQMKDFKLAEEYTENAVKIYKAFNSEPNGDILRAYELLGKNYMDAGLYHEASVEFEKTIELSRQIGFNENPDVTQMAFMHYGEICAVQHRKELAQQAYQQAYNICLQAFGKEDERTKEAKEKLEVV